jgi:hypothetical protein
MAQMDGPTVRLAGNATAAPVDSHIFFQIKAGDSQFPMSVKVTEMLGDVTA